MSMRVLRLRRTAALALLSLLLLVSSSCAHRRAPVATAWRLDGSGPAQLLKPPAEFVPVKHVYRIPVEGLRLGRSSCQLSAGGITLRPARGGPALVFDDSLLEPGMRPVDRLEQFREAALRSEDSGCLPPDSALRLVQTLVESLPLSPGNAFGMRFGAYELNGAVTLEPGFRLKVVAPLLKAGYTEIKTSLAPASGAGALEVNVEGLEGFETAYYDVRPRSGAGVEFALASVEQNRIGKIPHPPEPGSFHFDIAPDIHRFRLLFLRRLSLADRDISLLGARNWDVLLSSAQRFDTVPGSVAECTTTPGLQCVAVTTKTAILAEIEVSLNGKPAYVPVGGNLAELLNNAGFQTQEQQDEALARLKVERMWRGRPYPVVIDPKNSLTFGLVLFPGDRVSW